MPTPGKTGNVWMGREGHVGATGTWYSEALLNALHAQGSLPTHTHSYPAQSAMTEVENLASSVFPDQHSPVELQQANPA